MKFNRISENERTQQEREKLSNIDNQINLNMVEAKLF